MLLKCLLQPVEHCTPTRHTFAVQLCVVNPSGTVQIASSFSHMLSLHNLSESVVTSGMVRTLANACQTGAASATCMRILSSAGAKAPVRPLCRAPTFSGTWTGCQRVAHDMVHHPCTAQGTCDSAQSVTVLLLSAARDGAAYGGCHQGADGSWQHPCGHPRSTVQADSGLGLHRAPHAGARVIVVGPQCRSGVSTNLSGALA